MRVSDDTTTTNTTTATTTTTTITTTIANDAKTKVFNTTNLTFNNSIGNCLKLFVTVCNYIHVYHVNKARQSETLPGCHRHVPIAYIHAGTAT